MNNSNNFAVSIKIQNHNYMNAIKTDVIPSLEHVTTTSEIEQNCISLEESKARVLEMVHKHFHK